MVEERGSETLLDLVHTVWDEIRSSSSLDEVQIIFETTEQRAGMGMDDIIEGMHTLIVRQTDRQPDKQIDRPADRQTDRETNERTEMKHSHARTCMRIYIYIYLYIYIYIYMHSDIQR